MRGGGSSWGRATLVGMSAITGQRKVRRLGRVRTRHVSKAKNLLSEVKVALFIPRALHVGLKRRAKYQGISLHHAIRLALMQYMGDDWADEKPSRSVVEVAGASRPAPLTTNVRRQGDNAATRRAEREFLLERMRDELPGTRPLFVEYLDDDGTGQWAFVKGSEG